MTVADGLVRLASTRLGRRGVLGRAAVIGSAAIVAPIELALTPTTAYAAVCRGGLCSTGFTEFCCTLTGLNACPTGTLTAGWWKVDGSQFCGGGPRFYLDCNAACGSCGCGSNGVCNGSCSRTGCGCAKGDCNNWKSGCNKFRYGQCHQDVRCVGPIVCRVVTCTPPWLFDAACGTSSRTDNNTRFHTRPCAETGFGAIDRLEHVNGELVISGWALSQDDYNESTLIRVYLDGVVAVDLDANQQRNDVAAIYPKWGGNHGFSTALRADPGPHFACLFGIDRHTGRGTFLGFKEVDVPAPKGAIERAVIDVAGTIAVTGWASDPTIPNDPPRVRVLIDGAVVSDAAAAVSRPDIAAQLGRPPVCGFEVTATVPVTVPATHEACLEVVDRFGKVRRIVCTPVVAAPA